MRPPTGRKTSFSRSFPMSYARRARRCWATLNLWDASEELPQTLRADVRMLQPNVELEARILDDLLDLTRIAKGSPAMRRRNRLPGTVRRMRRAALTT